MEISHKQNIQNHIDLLIQIEISQDKIGGWDPALRSPAQWALAAANFVLQNLDVNKNINIILYMLLISILFRTHAENTT